MTVSWGAVAGTIHQLGAAAAFGGSSLVKESEDGRKVLKAGWDRPGAIAHALLASGWFVEQMELRTTPLARRPRTQCGSRTCVAGAVITYLLDGIAGERMKRNFPDGVTVTANGELSPEAPAEAQRYQSLFKVLRLFNRLFIAGAIGGTPPVNFGLYKMWLAAKGNGQTHPSSAGNGGA